MTKRDVFPTTRRTWIGERLAAGPGGRDDVNRHVMEVYSFPLEVYFRGSAGRWLGEVDDVVHGFFASRLGKDDFLAAWEASGMRLRRWLMNAFSFYLHELRGERQRDARYRSIAELEPAAHSTVEQEIDRAFAIAIVRRALERTRALCVGLGLERHWEVFRRHYHEGRPYAEFAAELGLDAARAATMARTVAGKFRTTLREVLARDGASAPEINREIEGLLEATEAP